MNKLIYSLCITVALASHGFAQQEDSTDLLAEMNLVGNADFRFLFWKIYEAELYSTNGEYEYFENLPLALRLIYTRSFTAEHIVNETGNQFDILGLSEDSYADWLQELGEILVAVEPGDALLLYVDTESASHFYFNNEYIGSVENSEFSRHFSAIWLARDDRYADLTRRLTGEEA